MWAYIVIFSIFNFIISLFYCIYGLIIYKIKSNSVEHSGLPEDTLFYLNRFNFINVQQDWIIKFGIKVRNLSIVYFVLSEALCFAASYLTGKCILICRISLFAAVFLLLFWIFLHFFYYRKTSARLALNHKDNLKIALAKVEEMKINNN